MDYTKILSEKTKKIIDDFISILKKSKEYLSTDNNINANKLLIYLQEYNDKLINLSEIDNDIILTVCKYYSIVQDYFLHIDDVINILEETTNNPDINQTMKVDIINTVFGVRQILAELDKLEEKIKFMHYLTNTVVDYINKSSNKVDDILLLQSLFRENIQIYSLYSNILQQIISNTESSTTSSTSSTSNNISDYILEIVEADKNFILKDHFKSIYKNDNMHIYNPQLKKFGLIPATECLPLDKLIDLVCNIKLNDQLDLSKNPNVGFIIMRHVTNNPIEYNLQKFIVKKQNSSGDFSKYGVNIPLIDRLTIINKLKENNKKVEFKYEIVNKKANKIYVLETLDNVTYRCLTNMININYDANSIKIFHITDKTVKNIINYIENGCKQTRISNYQNIVIKDASKNMFLNKKLEMESFESNKFVTPLNIIKLEIFNKIQKYVVETYPEIINQDLINQIIHDKNITEILEDNIIKLYPTVVSDTDIKELKAGDFKFSEIYSSFITELQQIKVRFEKELHDGYNRSPLPNKIFVKLEKNTHVIIEKKILQVIQDALDLIMKNKDDIYSSMHYKYLLLNFM